MQIFEAFLFCQIRVYVTSFLPFLQLHYFSHINLTNTASLLLQFNVHSLHLQFLVKSMQSFQAFFCQVRVYVTSFLPFLKFHYFSHITLTNIASLLFSSIYSHSTHSFQSKGCLLFKVSLLNECLRPLVPLFPSFSQFSTHSA